VSDQFRRARPWFLFSLIFFILGCCSMGGLGALGGGGRGVPILIPDGGGGFPFPDGGNDDWGGGWNTGNNSGSWDWGGGDNSGSWNWGGDNSGSWNWGGGNNSGSWDWGGGNNSGSWDWGGNNSGAW